MTETTKPAALPKGLDPINFWAAFNDSGASEQFVNRMNDLVKALGGKGKPSNGQVDTIFTDVLIASKTFEMLTERAQAAVNEQNWQKIAAKS